MSNCWFEQKLAPRGLERTLADSISPTGIDITDIYTTAPRLHLCWQKQTLILSVETRVTDTHATALRLHSCWQRTDADSIRRNARISIPHYPERRSHVAKPRKIMASWHNDTDTQVRTISYVFRNAFRGSSMHRQCMSLDVLNSGNFAKRYN